MAAAILVFVLVGGGDLGSASAQPASGPSSFGFAANGTCQSGVCPPSRPLTSENDITLPVDFTFKSASGDQFRIVGVESQTNHGSCQTFSTKRQWSIQYVGTSQGGPSKADTFNLDVWLAWACVLRNGNGNWDISGTFSRGIAPDSSLVTRWDRGTPNWTFGPFTPPSNFSKTYADSGIVVNGPLLLHQQYTVTFGAGSAVCSYISIGNQPPACTPAPGVPVQPQTEPSAAPTHAFVGLSSHVDRSTGGHLASDDGRVQIDVPASEDQHAVDVKVTRADQTAPATLSVGALNMAIAVDDESGNPVTAFDDPLTVAVRPFDDDVAAAGGDPTAISVTQLDPEGSGNAVPVPATGNPDGTLTIQLNHLAR